jgi:macrolide transport system ATP-binding/permease protein
MSVLVLPTVHIADLDVWFGGHHVLHDVNLVAQPGHRIGVIGENGAGKSTLLHAIARTLPNDALVHGTVDRPADLVMLGQQPAFRDDQSVAGVLAEALAPLRALVREVERLAVRLADSFEPGIESVYAGALDRALAQDAWDADRRASEAAQRLGLGDVSTERPVGTLSGGQRARLALTTLIATRPGCVLLDEPTNHLDDDAVALLTEFLRDLPGVVLLASHDRVLLDDVCTDLFDLDPSELGTDGRGGRRFGGGWSQYEAHRAAARRRWEETYAAQQEELRRLRDATVIGTSSIAHNRPARDRDKFINHFKGQNVDRTLARRKRDAQRRLEVAEREQVRKPRPPLRLRARLTGASTAGKVVQVRELVVSDRLRLARLEVEAGEHLLVSGENGSGKSTLLGVLSGRVTPTGGSVLVGAQRVAELVQDVRFEHPDRSARSTYDAMVGAEYAVRTPLRDLGLLPPARHATPVGLLSEGQRRRLALAVAIAGAPDLLLLDEPTNHLSMALAGEIEDALQTTPGTVVVATHDRWLRRRWEGAHLQLSGTCEPARP